MGVAVVVGVGRGMADSSGGPSSGEPSHDDPIPYAMPPMTKPANTIIIAQPPIGILDFFSADGG